MEYSCARLAAGTEAVPWRGAGIRAQAWAQVQAQVFERVRGELRVSNRIFVLIGLFDEEEDAIALGGDPVPDDVAQ